MTDRTPGRTPGRSTQFDDRGVSIAVTHVLTVGMTTLLIAGLLIGTSGMLDAERKRAGQGELEAIGDRHAAEVVTAVDSGARSNANLTVRSRQPDQSLGGSYLVRLTNDSRCRYHSGYDGCLYLETSNDELSVEVPLTLPRDSVTIDGATVQGGEVVVEYYDGPRNVTIRGER